VDPLLTRNELRQLQTGSVLTWRAFFVRRIWAHEISLSYLTRLYPVMGAERFPMPKSCSTGGSAVEYRLPVDLTSQVPKLEAFSRHRQVFALYS
jgi:hypothetical protein